MHIETTVDAKPYQEMITVKLTAVAAVLAALMVGCQTATRRPIAVPPADPAAYEVAMVFGLSEDGAKEWSRYAAWAHEVEATERILVEQRIKDQFEFRPISLTEFVRAYPDWVLPGSEAADIVALPETQFRILYCVPKDAAEPVELSELPPEPARTTGP